MAMAKRGIKSLAIAVSLPVGLTLLAIYLSTNNGSGSGSGSGRTNSEPFWFPPLWAFHVICIVSSFLMGLAAWLVWANGGFHKKPATLYLYLVQLGLGLIWDPIVFGSGLDFIGLIVCLGMFGALIGCSRAFKKVNPISGHLTKPCIAWAAFLAIVNIRLVFV